jgi:hypothetical protein
MQAVVSPESQLHLSAMTDQHAGAALRWLKRMRNDEWNLTIDEARELLGGIPRRTYLSWENKASNNELVQLRRDVLERLSLLLGIYKGLKLFAPNNNLDVAYEWFTQRNTNPIFLGLSIKEYLLKFGSIKSLYTVREYLDQASV